MGRKRNNHGFIYLIAMRSFIIFFQLIVWVGVVHATDYNASFFGIKSDGITDNTSSIQKAMDYIHENKGGTLVFYVGRYVTGTIHLRPGVNIRLEEGAVLVGSKTPYAYHGPRDAKALFEAENLTNIKIYGKGIIEGGGRILVENMNELVARGYFKESSKPGLLTFTNCRNVTIEGIRLWNGAYSALTLKECKNVHLKNLEINGNNIPTSVGIVIKGCKWVDLSGLFVKVMGRPLTVEDNQFLTVKKSISANGDPISGI